MTFNMYWLHHSINLLKIVPFLGGWLSDRLLGDPEGWPHPIVWFGKAISAGEKELNKGSERVLKGGILAVVLILGVYLICERILSWAWIIHPQFSGLLTAVGVFYCLSGKTLIKEVKAVFEAVDRSTEEGRRQVARIVGRDTSNLSPQEIRAAALETLSENLSDGVIAPMFWFALLGLPGMMAYKMVNTLDSMIGYKNERYLEFGRIAALIDDIANYIPARLTAYLMLLVSNNWGKGISYGVSALNTQALIPVIQKRPWRRSWTASSGGRTIISANRWRSLISGRTRGLSRPRICVSPFK